jgi:hypothetical protein
MPPDRPPEGSHEQPIALIRPGDAHKASLTPHQVAVAAQSGIDAQMQAWTAQMIAPGAEQG